MSLPTSSEMAQALSTIFTPLYEKGLIADYSPIEKVRNSLFEATKKGSDSWKIFVGEDTPIIFKEITDRNGEKIIPQILAHLEIDILSEQFPYKRWDICLELNNKFDQQPITKWHFDLANPKQSGPKIHMQCGGHFSGNSDRRSELRLQVPRWHHPAFDLLLLTEVAIANFYEEEWRELRELPSWCSSISMSQHLCYGPYLEKIRPILDQSSVTILKEIWNDNWN